MPQFSAWEREYANPTFLTLDNEPQKDTTRFARYVKDTLRKRFPDSEMNWSGMSVLDLGSGTGRNTNYFAELGTTAFGIELSSTAVRQAKKDAEQRSLTHKVKFIEGTMGEKFPFEDNQFDIVIDVTSSNSLTEKEREIYLKEVYRVLKKDGFFFVKALAKDGDQHAKYLIAHNPGKEKDTYIIPEQGIQERVFTKQDFISTYSPFFTIDEMDKKTTYTRFGDRSFKRNFWIVYMSKK